MKKIQKSAVRFDNLKQDFLDDKKYSGTAEATLNGYRYDITRFLKFLSDEQLAVNEAGFKRYVIHLTDSGMTANSVNHYIRSVKVFLYWCMEQDEIAPFKIKMVKAQETIKDVYTQEELCALIQPPKREDSFVIWRSWAIINFILGTAARGATVCEMQMQDISFDDRTITFRHADTYNFLLKTTSIRHADTYNFLLKTTSIDNLDGFPIAADKLSSVDTTLSSVIRSFSNGNSAKKTQMDIRTIADLSDYLTENIHILEQITAPSEAWVAERLQNVDDILEIQAVTPDNDPNGLLNKEDGGYTACIYFTSTGINVDGDSPVSKGTDGGGAIEVYGTLEDAEARCEYLHGFDNTILYTGSYAIVGTMVIRISYIYTTEEQYEMTNRITKELTKLEKTAAE